MPIESQLMSVRKGKLIYLWHTNETVDYKMEIDNRKSQITDMEYEYFKIILVLG